MKSAIYITAKIDRIKYPHIWVAHFSIDNPDRFKHKNKWLKYRAAELYTELIRFQSGYYDYQMDGYFKQHHVLRKEYVEKKMDCFAFNIVASSKRQREHTNLLSFVVYLEDAMWFASRNGDLYGEDRGLKAIRDGFFKLHYVVSSFITVSKDSVCVLVKCSTKNKEDIHRAFINEMKAQYDISISTPYNPELLIPATFDPTLQFKEWDEVSLYDPAYGIALEHYKDMEGMTPEKKLLLDSFEYHFPRAGVAIKRISWNRAEGYFIPCISTLNKKVRIEPIERKLPKGFWRKTKREE